MSKSAMICFKKQPEVIKSDAGAFSHAIERDGNYLLPYEWREHFDADTYEVVLVDESDEPSAEGER